MRIEVNKGSTKENGDILLRQVTLNFCSIIAALSFSSFRSFVWLYMSIADRDNGGHASIQKIGGSGFSIYAETEKSFEESFEFTSWMAFEIDKNLGGNVVIPA